MTKNLPITLLRDSPGVPRKENPMCKSKDDGGRRCLAHVKQGLGSKNRQVEQKTAHLEALRAEPTNGEIRKRIIRLEDTLERLIVKRDELQAEFTMLDAEAKLKQEQTELDRKQKRKVKNEHEDHNLESDFKIAVTDDERDEIEDKREGHTVADYLIHTAMNKPLGHNSKVRALAELDMRKTSRHRVAEFLDEEGNTTKTQLSQGRMPTEDATVRDKYIKIQNGIKNRTAATHYLNVMSQAYGLSRDAYVRMRALGKDMYEPHAHLSDESNKYRLRHQMKMEREAGIDANSTKEQILEARRKYDEEASQRAWAAVEKKFGAHAVTALRGTYGA